MVAISIYNISIIFTLHRTRLQLTQPICEPVVLVCLFDYKELVVFAVVGKLLEINFLLLRESELTVDRAVDRALAKKLLVNIGCIFIPLCHRTEWGLHTLIGSLHPVYILEERVILYFIGVGIRTTQSLQGVRVHEFPQKVIESGGSSCLLDRPEVNLTSGDRVEKLHFVLVLKGWTADQHFVY